MIVVRFTRDLRLDDHAVLAAAAERGPVLPALVLDAQTVESLRRCSRRAAFYLGAVRALDEALRERGSALVVRRGEATPVLASLAYEAGARGVLWSARYDDAGAREDRALQAALEESGLEAHPVDDAPAIAPEAIERGGDGGYRAFRPYLDRWHATAVTSFDLPILLRFAKSETRSDALPTAQELGASVSDPDANPREAAARVRHFLEDGARVYTSARHVPAQDGTSHLSAHLTFGTLSLRTVVRATRDALDNPFLLNEERRSLRTFARSLALRDFFTQLAFFHPRTGDAPLQERMRDFPFASSHPSLDAWRSGRTGFPLVDAGMRELAETGWMHPHVRAVAASFLCFDLGVDWRVGRAVWADLAVDDDAAIATGNWQWIAGVGADLAQHPRIYNPERQRRRIDPEGRYVRRWIPELRHVPLGAATDDVPMLPLYDGGTYPAPVVDHAVAARAFLGRYRTYLTRRSVAK